MALKDSYSNPSLARTGTYLVLFTALVSGFSIFINSFAVKGFDSSVFTFSKNVVVALFLFAIILGVGKLTELRSLSRKAWSQLVLIGLVGGSIPFLLFFKGLQMTSGATSGFIHKTMFVYVAVLALLFLKEKLSKAALIGTGLLLFGTYLMLRPDFVLSTGHLLVLGATVLWAIENVISKNALKEISGTTVAFGRMFFGSLFILVFLAFTGKVRLLFSMNSDQWVWIIITSLYLLLYVISFYNGLKHISVTSAACILALGAPITTLLGIGFNGAAVGIYEAIGMLLVIVGVVAVVWSSQVVAFVLRLAGVRRDG